MKIKADGRVYEFPDKLEMGEQRLLKREFDFQPGAPFDPENIDHVAGLLCIAMMRTVPGLAPALAIKQVDTVTTVEFIPDEDETEPDPTPGGDEAATG